MTPSDGSSDSSPDISNTDRLVKELLDKQGVHLDANVKLNVVTRRIKVNADGSRTVIEDPAIVSSQSPPKPRGRALPWIAGATIALGLSQIGYAVWAGMSDNAVAPVFRAAPSCRIGLLNSPGGVRTAPNDACRIDQATVIALNARSSRGGRLYYVVTLTADGTRDDIPLAAQVAAKFWNRLTPTEHVRIQRFVADGYHLTGEVVAVADDTSAAMSAAHPDSGTHYNAAMVIIGVPLVVIGLSLLTRRRKVTAS